MSLSNVKIKCTSYRFMGENMSEEKNNYQIAWESFWKSLTGDQQDVLWNVSHDEAASSDFELFREFVEESPLPLVDTGCGDGTQTEFFGQHLKKVVGVDVSAAAIQIAQQNSKLSNISYQVLDLLNTEDCIRFHQRLGDSHVYMRGVLMQFSPEDRLKAVANLKILIGSQGYLFMNEYVPQTKAYYQEIFQQQGMPAGFHRVLQHGITPGGITDVELKEFFPDQDYEPVRKGNYLMHTNIQLADGSYAKAPSFYLILKKR